MQCVDDIFMLQKKICVNDMAQFQIIRRYRVRRHPLSRILTLNDSMTNTLENGLLNSQTSHAKMRIFNVTKTFIHQMRSFAALALPTS